MKRIFQQPLFIFEMANNHMGDGEHGLRMIDEFSRVARRYPFDFAFKFQFRDINTFIHPDFHNRMDIKYVKRFTETGLSMKQISSLKKRIEEYGFKTICTPFDEVSVDNILALDFDMIKIASCSFNDWPLLEKIVTADKPVIASTAGVSTAVIDNVVSFFHHRNKQFAILHCVGEYPTVSENLQLNQIDYLKNRYPDIPIGYSTHEEPDNVTSVQLAVAKGAMIFEKHIAVVTEKYPKNAYSATPEQIDRWLKSAESAYRICGVKNRRKTFSSKELNDLRQFKRGVFVKYPLKKGEHITVDNSFFAFPNQSGQLLANDMSKYSSYEILTDIEAGSPVLVTDVSKVEIREKVYAIVKDVRKMLKTANVIFPGRASLEISHHYGIDRFQTYGSTMITVVNREYCKKLIIVMPGQTHPEQFHKLKEETFIILHGDIDLKINGVLRKCSSGDVVTIKPGEKHEFSSAKGAVIEEISSTHLQDDSFYSDPSIKENPNRKTYLTHWLYD